MNHERSEGTGKGRKNQQHSQQSNNGLQIPEGMKRSEFLSNLYKIPLVYTTVSLAVDLYERAKGSSRIVGGALSFAETGVHLAQGIASPFVNRLTPVASAPLSKVDDLATKGLLSLEKNVPVIKKQPQEIYSDAKGVLETRLQPTVQRLNGVTNSVLSSSVAQFSFDIYEKVLFVSGTLLNGIIPPSQDPEQSRFPHDKRPEDKSARGTWLAKESYYLVTSVCSRVFGLAQSRLDSAIHAAQNMKKTL